MNPSNATSAPGSATTSRTAPTSPPHKAAPAAGDPSAKLSESEFLEQQAEAAKAAIATAFSELKADIATGADPRLWMKTHPWITLASATVAGFAAAASVIPSKEQQALRKLEAVERALHRAHRPEAADDGNGHPAGKQEHRGLIAMLLHEVLGVIKPAIISLIASHFSPPPEPDADDGKYPSEKDPG